MRLIDKFKITVMKYIDGTLIKVGDVFTDGTSDNMEQVRQKNRAKVLYVDSFNLVWFPLNDFTTHTRFEKEKFRSKTWCLSSDPKKIEIEELTEDELEMYNSSNKFVGLFF